MLPLMLNLTQRKVLVVGGGAVATRRVRKLLEHKARVTLVALEITPELRQRVDSKEITFFQREFVVQDVRGAWLVLEHSGSAVVQQLVFCACESEQIWYLLGGSPAESAFWNMAHRRVRVEDGQEELTVAVSGHGSPRRAKAVVEYLSRVAASSQNLW